MGKYEHEIVLNYLKRMLLNKYEAEDCNIENGLFNNEVKIHYTYGHIDTLREKAKVLAKDDKILVITIDKVEEVIKDIRNEKLIEYAKGE